ncbi:hypothetical protein [Nostoc sp.]|uniref:hypothetical protein n=1 Tax=Nostoc sp. TaxID=1180 RepID=UPI002FF5A1B6
MENNTWTSVKGKCQGNSGCQSHPCASAMRSSTSKTCYRRGAGSGEAAKGCIIIYFGIEMSGTAHPRIILF